jgi:uncharacterized protein (DUF924 family)
MTEAAQPAYKRILDFWFGSVEETVIPSENRARVWFGDNPQVDEEICSRFAQEHRDAAEGKLPQWEETAHGKLALILMLDQFSRHLFRNSAEAFDYDTRALEICMHGIGTVDHELSLIERVFYFFPLLHSERPEVQEVSVQCYNMLVSLALPETKVVYDSFMRFANHHYSVIQQFGRFPQRNQLLGRDSTPEELTYLKEQEGL